MCHSNSSSADELIPHFKLYPAIFLSILIVATTTVYIAASFPVVLGDFGCDVTCQACRESSPSAIALGSKPPLVTQIARTGLGMRLCTL